MTETIAERVVTRALSLLRRKKFEIGRAGVSRYLTRWVLWGERFGDPAKKKLYLHLFHRGDVEPYCHDHPWPFWSLILWGGYWEITPVVVPVGDDRDHRFEEVEQKKWYGPGSFLRRPADWAHRVELPAGRTCWTLFWAGKKERQWGFLCPRSGWLYHRDHDTREKAGLPGCPE